MGIGTDSDNWFVKDLPLFIAFAVLAAYTYSAGLRAPALIAFVKDTLIYIVIIVAVLYLPSQLGGWDHIFARATDSFATFNTDERRRDRGRRGRAQGHDPAAAAHWAYASLALGSALALFMYPHSVTARALDPEPLGDPAQRRAAAGVLLPARTARAARLRGDRRRRARSTNPQQAVPQLFENEFPPGSRASRSRRS